MDALRRVGSFLKALLELRPRRRYESMGPVVTAQVHQSTLVCINFEAKIQVSACASGYKWLNIMKTKGGDSLSCR